MAFVAHARPKREQETLGHACLFAEQGNRVRIPDTERSCFGEKQRSGLPKVAVFRKHCFHVRGNLTCGENRSLDGLSWPGEKAEAMRWCRRS